MSELIYGLIIGVLFGSLLQIGGVLRYDRQVGAMRLIDMTIVKFMLAAILVATIGFQALQEFGVAGFKLKPTIWGANIVGGLIFGVGWGIFGYCPGTAVGALGEGRWDALWGINGMIAGAGAFAEAYPFFKRTLLSAGDYGKIALPGSLGINPWIVIALLAIIFVLLFRFFEQREL
jgi:uncharacterized membrane protein YedE/YeeE